MIAENQKVHKTLVPCRKCGDRVFSVTLSQDLIDAVERFPFTIVLMHVGEEDGKREVHTMVAYIDKDLNCRHVEILTGKKVFITPYILYNPNLLYLSCNKNLGNVN